MKPLYPDLFPETLLVSREGDRIFTTSLKVAEHFHKRHDNVVRAIENVVNGLKIEDINEPKIGLIEEFCRLNFQPAEYQDSRGRTKPMYRLTHDGFAVLAMGFTGTDALVWKIEFLAAFREMERQLHAQKERAEKALYFMRPAWPLILGHPDMRRQQLIGLTGHKSPGSITACRRRMRDVGLLDA